MCVRGFPPRLRPKRLDITAGELGEEVAEKARRNALDERSIPFRAMARINQDDPFRRKSENAKRIRATLKGALALFKMDEAQAIRRFEKRVKTQTPPVTNSCQEVIESSALDFFHHYPLNALNVPGRSLIDSVLSI